MSTCKVLQVSAVQVSPSKPGAWPWVWVPEVQEVNGKKFFLVNKWDRSLVKWCLESGLSLGKDSSNDINVKWFDELVKSRSEASHAAYDAAVDMEDAENQDEDSVETPPKKKRRRKAKNTDQHYAPIVTIDVPSIAFGGETVTVPDNKINVLFAVAKVQLYVELTEANLMYIKAAVNNDRDKGKDGKKHIK